MTEESTLSRRSFLSVAAAGALGLRAMRSCASGPSGGGGGGGGASGDRLLYVGTYTTGGRSRGIYTLRMARDSGAITFVGDAAATENPSFVLPAPGGRALYAVNEIAQHDGRPTGTVSAFARDPSTGALTALGDRRDSLGASPCWLSFDRARRYLFVANYGSGSVAVLPILAGGALGDALSSVQHEGHGADPKRQAAPHAHCIVADPSNRFVLAADLGIDAILVHAFDARTGALSPTPVARGALAAGAGPRHLLFHPDGRTLYVTNELDSTLTTFRYDPERGTLDDPRTVATLGEPFASRNAPADIHLHPSGRFLYLSNRGHDSIALFAIDAATHTPRLVRTFGTEGTWPRNFAIEPGGRFLLVANQHSDSVTVFRVDAETGNLAFTGQKLDVPAPTCLRFADEAGGVWR